MIIKKLRLHNFGVYAGDNEFIFKGEKPVVLIGGMNGRGKTTFLEAILLALYGSNSFAYVESGTKSYLHYLRAFVNRSSADQTCSIELEFEINNGVKENYIIKREWDAISKRIKEQISVLKDGVYNEFLTNNWPMFVENILPSALSSFFFFDGEKIAELAVDNTSVQLKNSIRSMLGISVLDVLNNDIMRNLRKINKNKMDGKSADEIQQLREDKEMAVEAVEDIDEQIKKAKKKLIKDNEELEELHQNYTMQGGEVIEKRQNTMKKRASLVAELVNVQERLDALVSDILPLLLVNDLIMDIKLQATDEHMDSVMHEAVLQLDNMFQDFSLVYEGDRRASLDFLNFVKNQTAENQVETIYELSDQALFQVNNLVESSLSNVWKETKLILNKKNKLEKQIEEIDSYLALDINERELQDIHKKIKFNEQIVIEDKIIISQLEQKRSSANAKVLAITAEFNKNVETYLSSIELKDSTDRMIKYSNMALNIIDRYRIELQRRKTDILAKTITECYLKLANKKDFIKKIVMDPESLNIVYLSEDGSEIPKDSLSAGEQQLMVISILWSLAICSKKKLPVIIDTPLSRLDSLHRTSLITTYFPNAGEQTIILSTDSEIDETYYQLMKENIGDEFTLKYNEKTKSTSIERGYLIGAKL